ncbi:MAG: hypothetical protein WBY47_04290 [Desulfobacterales bacterium]|jgi:hypothetical protein
MMIQKQFTAYLYRGKLLRHTVVRFTRNHLALTFLGFHQFLGEGANLIFGPYMFRDISADLNKAFRIACSIF